MKYVLLDRDGVINRRIPGGYVTAWENFVFAPGALEGLRLLALGGYSAVVVSNQACVGKGLITSSGLNEITCKFVKRVEEYGGRIEAVYYCPHRKEDACKCRKPQPGLLLEAQGKHQFEFASTFLIGDSESDLLAAYAVGSPALLISAGSPVPLGEVAWRPRAILPNLLAAAQFIRDIPMGESKGIQKRPVSAARQS